MIRPIPASDRSRLLQIIQRDVDAGDFETSIRPPPASGGAVEKPTIKMAEKSWENKQLSEKQISVDPISLQQQRETAASFYMPPLPPPPAKSKFVSCSLPNSASSSPARFKKKNAVKKDKEISMDRQGSRLRESHLQRSKSCGDGRASQPSVDFDLMSSPRLQLVDHDVNSRVLKNINIISNASGTTQERNEDDREEKIQVLHGGIVGSDHKNERSESHEDKFKCGLICPFLPSLGKAKSTVERPKSSSSSSKNMQLQGSKMRRTDSVNTTATAVSKRVSLEKFECGSWRSSAVVNCDLDDGLEESVFFDLPVELIRSSNVNDTESPITTGFMFDNSSDKNTGTDDNTHQIQHLKGVLKNSRSSRGQNGNLPAIATGRGTSQAQECSNRSPRHVRFSTSSPPRVPASSTSCGSPQLHKVRGDFNAFLEAQSA